MLTFNRHAFLLAWALCLASLSGADVPSVELPRITAFQVEDADVLMVVQTLRQHYAYGVCFERESLDPKTQGITSQNLYETLSKKKELTKTEREDLKIADITRKENPHALLMWNIPRRSFALGNVDIRRAMDEILRQFPNYTCRIDANGWVIIFPAVGSLLQFEVGEIAIHGNTISESLEPCRAEFEKRHIIVTAFLGPHSKNPLSVKVDDLKMKPAPCIDLLTALAQAAQEKMEWSLLGMKRSRMLTFDPVRPPALPRE